MKGVLHRIWDDLCELDDSLEVLGAEATAFLVPYQAFSEWCRMNDAAPARPELPCP